MKDPLQREPTPYEVLQVPLGAGPGDIDAAFKAGLVAGGNVNRLTAAKRALTDPVERGMVDALLYEDAVLGRLQPSPCGELECLALDRRSTTAADWASAFTAEFPDAGLAHAIAVLVYWWAVAEEERVAQGGAPASPAAEEIWEAVIAFWGMLVATDEAWSFLPEPAREAVRRRFVERLRHRIADSAQRRRERGQDGDRYGELDLLLTTELATARELAGLSIRTDHGRVCCGPLMLARVGLLESMRAQVEEALAHSPAAEPLRSLSRALSPLAPIEALLAASKPDAALAALEKAPPDVRGSAAGRSVAVRALDAQARQLASVGRLEEALAAWAQALERGSEGPEAVAIRAELVRECQSRSAALQRTDLDQAVAILGKGLEVCRGDTTLTSTLGELLAQRGVGRLNAAQKAIQGKGELSREQQTAIEAGVGDLERAAALGSERARENLEGARQLLQAAKAGLLGLPPHLASAMQRANEAAGRHDWDSAVAALEEALGDSPARAAEPARQMLAQVLNARAVAHLNGAAGEMQRKSHARSAATAKEIDDYLAGRPPGGKTKSSWASNLGWIAWIVMALAAGVSQKSKAAGAALILVYLLVMFLPVIGAALKSMTDSVLAVSSPFGSRERCSMCGSAADYKFALPGHGPRALCSAHANGLRAIAERPPAFDLTEGQAIFSAVEDLKKAADLDPSASQIRENLQQAEAMGRQVAESFKQQLAAKGIS